MTQDQKDVLKELRYQSNSATNRLSQKERLMLTKLSAMEALENTENINTIFDENNIAEVEFEEAPESNKVVRTQTFTIEVKHHADKDYSMIRTNDGFNVHELLGILAFAQQEICKQLAGEIKPSVIERRVIVD